MSITQIGSYFYRNSVAEAVEKEIVDSSLGNNVVVTEITQEMLNDEAKRNEAIIKAIKEILGNANQTSGA